jgi:S-adenosylmethionine:tRNA ribosyltransferase-isomerase
MRASDFDYILPPERIAQTPIEPRDHARLLVLHRDTGALEHRVFTDLVDYLRPGDLLVANQSRVLPARLLGVKESSGGRVELLLLAARADLGPDRWEALARPSKRIHEGQRLLFGDGALVAEVEGATPGGERVVRLVSREGTVAQAVERVGVTPLPPYIHEKLADPERYQTVYAHDPGSAAAPTAGLHFTPALLERIEAMGVGIAYVTLHIGLDTFRPVEKDDLTDHVMHSEGIEVNAETAARVNATRATGGRIFAVGTTSTRTLEAVAGLAAERGAGELLIPYQGRTALFITPSYQFRAVDALITNFHLPRSTLLALVSAFAGRERILAAYAEAIAREYRFYSFGDAMLLI